MLCFDFWIAAKSRRSAAILPFMSMPELARAIQYYCPVIAANPRPAATVVVMRDSPAGPEVFMVRRHQGTAFMGGSHVFPGGRVDPGDRGTADASWCDGVDAAASQLADLPAVDAVAFHIAALRELFEEAGVLLAR